MGKPGNPAKQERPDGRQPMDEVTKAFPPSLSMVMTEIEVSLVPFAFAGGKGIDLNCKSGDLNVHIHFPPQVAEVVIEAIREVKMKADTGLVPANWDDVQRLAKGNGAKG